MLSPASVSSYCSPSEENETDLNEVCAVPFGGVSSIPLAELISEQIEVILKVAF